LIGEQPAIEAAASCILAVLRGATPASDVTYALGISLLP